MISALMLLSDLVRLPGRLAWRTYVILWWAFADGESMRSTLQTPSRRMRACYWLSVAGMVGAGAGAFLLWRHEVFSPFRAWLAFGCMTGVVFAGSACAGARRGRQDDGARPARSVESTIEGASRLLQAEGRAGPPGRRAAGPPAALRRGWTTVREGGRRAASAMSVAAKSGWAGAKHAADTYRSLSGTPRG